MIIQRKEPWGEIQYDTVEHLFSYRNEVETGGVPYSKEPVLLNVDLTLKCNMDCPHCVAKDFEKLEDLIISDQLIDWINDSPFLVIVITGGEPFLPAYETKLITLIRKIKKKGLIIDTNGTIIPSQPLIDAINETNTLVRVSMDSVSPKIEATLRRHNFNSNRMDQENIDCYNKKLDLINYFNKKGVSFAIQTVLNESNRHEIKLMVEYLKEHSIKKWYIQRFIPAHRRKTENFTVSRNKYNEISSILINECQKYNIECIIKKDLRHNCVVLLVGKGVLYTQSQQPGKKIRIGTIYDSKIDYFDYISAVDHAERYYG